MHTMLIIEIGINRALPMMGVVLTPEEYLHHPAYHPFRSVSSTYLFVKKQDVVFKDKVNWFGIDKTESSRYAVIQASEAERIQLKEAGYRMVNL